jgi:septum formation protein
MILDVLPLLRGARIVLASASPRRSEMLRSLGLVLRDGGGSGSGSGGGGGATFEVVPSRFDETLDKQAFATAAQYAKATAAGKLAEVRERLLASAADSRVLVIISCDTVVEAPSGEILEKPRDAADAARMLRLLSGAAHKVHSGVVVYSRGTIVAEFTETTEVDFAVLPEALIEAHSSSADDLDKAGGYAIQGRAASFVRGVRGDYANVVGLPLHQVSLRLREVALSLASAAPPVRA